MKRQERLGFRQYACRNGQSSLLRRKSVCFGICTYLGLDKSKYSNPYTCIFSSSAGVSVYTLGWSNARIGAYSFIRRQIDHKPPAYFKTRTVLTCTPSYLSVHKGSSRAYMASRCHYIINVLTPIPPPFSLLRQRLPRPTHRMSTPCLLYVPLFITFDLRRTTLGETRRHPFRVTLRELYCICSRGPPWRTVT